MAHVTDTISDRGQLVLVGGIVVAFALVALVLLLNTALFAQNIATRGVGPGPDVAAEHAAVTEQATSRIIRHEERTEYTSWDAAAKNLTRNVDRVETVKRMQEFQRRNAVAEAEVTTIRRGTALVQTDGSREFTAGGTAAPKEDWTLAETTGIRNFTMTVDATETDPETAPRTFTVRVIGDDAEEWTAEVYESNDMVEVSSNGKTCTSNAAEATIAWTDGELAGCSIPFAVDSDGNPLDEPYELRFENGVNATGSYRVVVSNQTAEDTVMVDSFGAADTTDNPRQYPAVYSAVLRSIYEDTSIDYETSVRAAPGEPNQTRPTT